MLLLPECLHEGDLSFFRKIPAVLFQNYRPKPFLETDGVPKNILQQALPCCRPFVVDLQYGKNLWGSTTIPFLPLSLQPSLIHAIDAIFKIAYTGLAMF